MIKSNLPVILLKGLVLLPHEEARIELNNNISKKIIDISKLYHDGEVLVVTPINDLEASPDTSDLPRLGVTAKIVSRIDLPNGNIRIVLKGQKRAKIISYVNYSNETDVLESIIIEAKEEEFNEVEEIALLRKLISELEKYISVNPYISNSILNQIKGIDDLDKLTDYIANFIPLKYEKKLSLMIDANRLSRARKLITEINIELAVLKLENKIEVELNASLDKAQKELILKEKIKAIKKELGEKEGKTTYVEKIKNKLITDKYPKHINERINYELERYESLTETSPELGTIKTYIDCLISIPFNKETKEETDLKKIKESLNKTHYGLKETKERILEYIAVKTSTQKTNSPIICLIGPPGVGKTSLAESIASSLNKKFAKISLGGLNDPNELSGHRKTYVGSEPGKIISSLIKTSVNNPVILLDEVDKIAKDYKGDPTGVLLDLLDPNSNHAFIDNYIEEEVNLSNVTWILTANDKSMIPHVLLDRLEIIKIHSYLDYEKINIAENYLIETSKKNNGINNIPVTFTRNALLKIINGYTYESGVRELERLINKIIRKIITEYKLNNKTLDKIIINTPDIKKYLSIEKYNKETIINKESGFIKALAYTGISGSTLEIEVTSYNGEEKIITTGYLGDILKESITVALSYIKANKDIFKIDQNNFKKTLHINFRGGGIPKDGPSAGIAIATALLSHLLKKEIPSYISMTGEITLLGDIQEIGGLREKAYSALKEGITHIYVPISNKRDILKLDDEIKNKITFIFVKNYIEIYNDIFKGENKW